MKNAVRLAWERMSLYLPVILMVLLALGSWWLVRNAPSAPQAVQSSEISEDPDYTMHHFMVKDFDARGRMQSEMSGARADHFPRTDTLEVKMLEAHGFAPDGTVTQAKGDKGISNADSSEVQLWGNAVVVRTPANKAPVMRFEGEFLHAWTQEERVRSHLPVVITRGKDRFTGDSLAYDNVSQTVQMQGRVRGVLQPSFAKP